MRNEDCIFCKIVAGEIPSYKVYEDDKFLAFLDINPVMDGHTLLIPKDHYPYLKDTPDNLTGEIFIKAKQISDQIREGLNCDFVQVSVVGKDVPHLHIHLMPRYDNDNLHGWQTKKYKDSEAESVLLKISSVS